MYKPLHVTATLDDLDDPVNQSDRAPLTGRITNSQAQSNTRAAGSTQGYLNSAIPGEDRRAPVNTIDESVWDTLRRDLLAVWEKMRQVLYPKYLLGGMMNQGGSGLAEANTEEGQGLMGGAAGAMGHIRGIVGRWPDADAVLQGGMSEGLRDWDLWYGWSGNHLGGTCADFGNRGPLLFCLLLSFLLSINAREDQRSLVFSGVFATIWIAEAIVTLQIKLLGGTMYVVYSHQLSLLTTRLMILQLLLPVRLHHRLHSLSTRHRLAPFRITSADYCANTSLFSPWPLVVSGRRQHSRWERRGEKPCRAGGVSAVCVLYWARLSLFHLLALEDVAILCFNRCIDDKNLISKRVLIHTSAERSRQQ